MHIPLDAAFHAGAVEAAFLSRERDRTSRRHVRHLLFNRDRFLDRMKDRTRRARDASGRHEKKSVSGADVIGMVQRS
jgi:hypothetical protein